MNCIHKYCHSIAYSEGVRQICSNNMMGIHEGSDPSMGCEWDQSTNYKGMTIFNNVLCDTARFVDVT